MTTWLEALSQHAFLQTAVATALLAGAVYVLSATFRQALDRRRARLAVARHGPREALRD